MHAKGLSFLELSIVIWNESIIINNYYIRGN